MVGFKNLKINLVGLDNAGKSSMLLVLKKMYDYEDEIFDLKPTIRIEHYQRDFLSYHLNFNDMGGQEKYREMFLQREIYFDEIDSFLYLIDITNEKRYEESIKYLKRVIDVLESVEFDKNKNIHICFTKMDDEHEFKLKEKFLNSIKYISNKINKKFPDFKFNFNCTSIFNPYSIIHVISKAISENIKEYSKLIDILKKFGSEYDLEHVLLYDNTGLIIAEYQKSNNAISRKEVNKILSNNLIYFKKIEEDKQKDFRFFEQIRSKFLNYGYKFVPKSINEDILVAENIIYISIVIDKNNQKKEDWTTFELIDACKEYFNLYIF